MAFSKFEIEFNSGERICLPTNGWVLWEGDLQEVGRIYRSLFFLEEDGPRFFLDGELVLREDFYTKHLYYDVGFVFDWGGLLSNKTLEENILLPLDFHKREKTKKYEEVREVFEALGYAEFLQQRPFFTPKNVQKLTSLIRALVMEPATLFIHNLAFGLEQKDKDFIERYLDRFTHLNLHFSEGYLHKREAFSDLIHIRQERKTA